MVVGLDATEQSLITDGREAEMRLAMRSIYGLGAKGDDVVKIFPGSPLHVSVSLRGKRRFGLEFLGRRYEPLLQQSSAKRLQSE